MLDRRHFLKAAGLLAFWPLGCAGPQSRAGGTLVNDIHSQLNPTMVDDVATVESLEEVQTVVREAGRRELPVCIAGGRHAMGAQQFATDAVLVDTTRLNRVLNFDRQTGRIEVESGIQWPKLMGHLHKVQEGGQSQWGIAQKQTGADRLSMGGALAANIHGRGLAMKPIIADVESFTLVDADGNLRACNRRENSELFRLVIGGYGLFGIVYSVTLRLVRRQKVQRIVKTVALEDLMSGFEKRIAKGFLYGDFQFNIDEKSPAFLRKGIFSCYGPVDPSTPIPEVGKQLSDADWRKLIHLAHTDKREGFRLYADHYQSTSGQIYWSDTHQSSAYLDDYHRKLDQKLGAKDSATEIITEIYVPRRALVDFMDEVRRDFRKNGVNVIYGTIRLVERDEESFLAWAKQPFACVIFNLHTVHTPEGLRHSASAFRRIIDMAIKRGGSYYLTYHKYAIRRQIEACYPRFAKFLALKKKYDPEERFQSDWYRHHKKMFAGEVTNHKRNPF